MFNKKLFEQVTNLDVVLLQAKTPYVKPERISWPDRGNRPIPGVPCPRDEHLQIKAILMDQKNEYRCPKDLHEMFKSGNFNTYNPLIPPNSQKINIQNLF